MSATPRTAYDSGADDLEDISGIVEISADAEGESTPAPSGWGSLADPGAGTPLVSAAARQTWSDVREADAETGIFGGPLPLAGRRAEIEAVYEGVRLALNTSQLQVIWLSGPAGSGRTRLLQTVERAAAPDKHGIGWLRIDAEERDFGPPSLAGRLLLELIGGVEVLKSANPFAEVRQQVAALLGQNNAVAAMAVVAPLLGLHSPEVQELPEMPVEAPMSVTVDFVATLLRQRARVGPCVVCVEAGQAAQSAELQAIVSAAQKSLNRSPVALLIDAPEPPQDPGGKTVHLAPLDGPTMLQLADRLLQRVNGVPVTLAAWLVETSQGLPGKLIDTLRGMVAAGEIGERSGLWNFRAESLELEQTPQTGDALPGRLSRLPAHLREVMEAAAIFGQHVWFGGLLSVLRGCRPDDADLLSERDRLTLEARLHDLHQLDVLKRTQQHAGDRDTAFAFTHPGDAPAVVQQLSEEKRRLLSRLAAQWLARRPRLDAVAENGRIAELYEQGGRRRLAAQHFLDAGTAARTVGQIHRALALFAAGSRSAHADNADLACDLRLAHGGALLRLGRHEEAEHILMDALRMALCLDDDLRCGTVQLRLAQVARGTGHYDVAEQFLEAALRHLRVAGAHRWIADVSDELGMVQLIRGGPDAYALALQHFQGALALRRRSDDLRVVARSLCHIARVQTGRGQFPAAHDAVSEATQICEQVQERWGLAEARMVQGEVLAASRKIKAAMHVWSQAGELASEAGDRARLLEVTVLQSETLLAVGKWEDAAARMLNATDEARELQDPQLLSGVYRVLATISLERQALETADLDSEKAVEIARESGAQMAVARAQIVRGCVLGTRALAEKGARGVVLDRRTTEAFEEAFDTLFQMGDLVRLVGGLRSCAEYLEKRGGGPRLTAVQARLQEIEAELRLAAA